MTRKLLVFLVAIAAVSTVLAEEDTKVSKIATPTEFVSNHAGRFNGRPVRYRARAGETYLRDEKDEPKATIFSFDYISVGAGSPETRPVTFVWNGGPGSASIWLHMGTIGPKRVEVPSNAAYAGPPPYPIVNNTEAPLDVTDLVFVDPVGTGYSRTLGDHEGKEFWGLNEDARSVAEFIRVWVTENQRWNSPKFLLGESYGTTRAAAVAEILEGGGDAINLNGIIFVSQAMDYTGSTPVADNLIAYVTYLPTMAATALYHGKIEPKPTDRDAFLADARAFAANEYLPALFMGTFLDPDRRKRVAERLAYFTGLSQAYVERADLRVTAIRFVKELMREEGLAVGRADGRYIQDEIDDTADSPARDPSSDAIYGAYKAALLDYVGRELGVNWNRTYLSPADPNLSKQWSYRTAPPDTYWEPLKVSTARSLSEALRRNPHLRVLVASGYYDLITPFFDAEYTLGRHGIQPDRVDYTYYDGGHMMYVHEPSREQLLEDIRQFVSRSLRR